MYSVTRTGRLRSFRYAERTAAEINVVKNRHGNIGVVPVTWHGGSTSYVNRSAADELGEVA
ncbi:DnaB-like helicase C-terminal domain-containing protein [Stenotrophomonas maltophilia]|nr:DnaB-like helicase C-terminal domain-containing protein [Stenotrophomonas maltophilia]